jgi:tetratricopeptide (TPR) repeat protein/predicted amidohydrolase
LPNTIKKQLASIWLLREKGESNTALMQLKTIRPEQFTQEELFAYKALEIRLQIDLGELNQALFQAKELTESNVEQINPLLAIDLLILQTEIYWRSANFDKALELVMEGLRRLETMDQKQEKEINQRRGELLHHEGITYWYKGMLDKAEDYYKKSLQIKEALNDKTGIATSLNNLGLVLWSKGELDQALKFYHRALEINEEIGNKRNIAATLTNLGNCYTQKGDLDEALDYQQRSLALKQQIGNKHDIALSLLNLGVVFQLKGDLNQAQDYYHKSLAICQETGLKSDTALAINNLGNIFELKGDLDQALHYFQKSLAIYKELGITQQIALLQANIGEVYRMKGDYKQAQDYYQRSLAICKKFGNEYLAAIVLFELVWVALERQDSSLVEQFREQLKEINNHTNNRIINQRYQLAQALILKTSDRARQKLKATEILEKIVTEEVGDHSLTVTAMIHLCDLLLAELKLTGESELIGDISKLTNQLLTIAKKQSSHSLLAETYLLQSKLALLEMDLGRANKLLTKAQTIADKTGLEKLAQTLYKERNLLDSQMQKWDRIIKENPSKQELIQLTNLDAVIERMIQETVTNLMDEKGVSSIPLKKKYNLVYIDLLKDGLQHEKTSFKVGIAQIGLSQSGDILQEYYDEQAPGLFRIQKNKINTIKTALRKMIKIAAKHEIKILAFPELMIDLNYDSLRDEVFTLARDYNMYIIAGSYHDFSTKQNISTAISPQGILWKQAKQIPATIHLQNQRITEGITHHQIPGVITIANTEYGRIAIIICRDFLDMDLRVELKNFEPPIDIIINPAFTPVTADFKATHFDARRSIYAYSFFVNVAEYGDSLIYSPEREREERTIPRGKEDIIYKDIDLFKLRAARKQWEREQQKTRSFIQSTR